MEKQETGSVVEHDFEHEYREQKQKPSPEQAKSFAQRLAKRAKGVFDKKNQ